MNLSSKNVKKTAGLSFEMWEFAAYIFVTDDCWMMNLKTPLVINIFPNCLTFYRHNDWSINEILNENNLKEGWKEEDIKHYTS